MKARRWLIFLTTILIVGGLWQTSGAAYIHAKAWLAHVLLEKAWVYRMTGYGVSESKPWPWADTAPVARIAVPHLDVDQIILAGASARTLAFGPAHLAGTVLPGEHGHSVITGHRDTHFQFLKELNKGDVLKLQQPDGQQINFRVTGTEIFDSRTAQLSIISDRKVMTLVTCYPFDSIRTGQPTRYAVFTEAE